jgi:hypothetical protein
MDQTDDPLPTSQAPEPVVEQIPIPVIESPTPSDDPPASPPSPLSPSPQSHSSTSTGNEQKQDEINEILDDILGERF